ncbi:hypothetical protein K2Y00_02015 [Patescibacteria group bacterium]|nr:hypothetical protein [Patescibacteria group bacterium]
MNNASRTNVIIIVLGIIVVLGALYMLFARGDSGDTVTEVTAPGSEAESAFLALTAEIGTISFNTGIFEDSRFRALRDIRTGIVPEVAGRPDPFAPLPGITAPAQ